MADNVREITDALQGDHAAIQRLADRIYDRDVEAEVVQARALEAAQAQINAQRERADFNEAARRFQAEYRDILEDPIAWRAAKELDAVLLAERPELTASQRLKAVGEHIRKEHRTVLDEDGDHAAAVREMQKARGRASLADEDERPEPDEQQRQWSEDIAALAAARMPHEPPQEGLIDDAA